ncbi:MAG: hypothetical protein WD512_02860 [Candidatus Paceibacterota bacterium]
MLNLTIMMENYYKTKLRSLFSEDDPENNPAWSEARDNTIKLMHELIYDYEIMVGAQMINEDQYIQYCKGLRQTFENAEEFHVKILQQYTHMKELQHWNSCVNGNVAADIDDLAHHESA